MNTHQVGYKANAFGACKLTWSLVPGSPIDIIYHQGTMIIQEASGIGSFDVLLMLFLGVIYLTLFRLIYPRLPSWLKSETALLTWKDLRLPALLAGLSVVLGLILIH